MMRALLPFSIAFLLSLPATMNGQQINITSGSAQSCSGVIEDSGGPNGEYSNGENITFTICPDVPGNVIYLTWFVFDLSTQGPQADALTIYDGDQASGTSLGTYSGSSLQNLIVSGTVFNTTGCLTLVFHSNGSGTGNFAAGFQCTIPCEYPTAVASMSELAPALICQNESISFDGSFSSAQQNYTIAQYLWDFDDGTLDSTSGPVVSHEFAEPGEYVVQLYVTDNNGCTNLNLVDLQVLVSTTPSFNQTDPSVEICFGETVQLYGQADPVTWTGIPDANFGEGIFLPDDVGLPFTSTLQFEQFDPGQEVTDMSNIQSICVSMEHTFMGDLVLQVICPNGQSVILHQQGGGGTYLGAPNDMDSNLDPVIGECWEYCWEPNATNGTWIDNTSNTTIAGTPPSGSLNPGTYESVQPMSNLVGCPLNGEWTYQSTDLWGADNGFICSWSINFDPAIIPDVTQFTPTWGPGSDSTAWNGGTTPDAISANGDTISFTPQAPGSYPFQYEVTDNFGCTYDTTITVTVTEPMVVNAGPDAVICNDPLQLEAMVDGATSTCEWTLQMDDTAWDGWNGASLEVSIDGSITSYTAFGNQTIETIEVTSGADITLTYSPGFWEGENSYLLIDDQGTTVFQDGPFPATGLVWNGLATCNAQNGLTWEWSPVEGISDPGIPDPTVIVTSETTFTVTVYPTGHPACAVSDDVTISLDPGLDPGSDSLIVVCATPPSFQLIDMLGGTPNTGGTWTDAAGNIVQGTFDPTIDPAGTYTYTVVTPLGCIGTADLEIEILAASDPSCCGVVDAGPDSTICTLSYNLVASIGNTGVGQWSGPAGYTFSDASDPGAVVTAPASGAAMFYWIEDDNASCYLIDSVTITFTEPLQATMAVTDAICFEACDGTASVEMTGGNGSFTYSWSVDPNNTAAQATGICAGEHSITIADENNCSTTAVFTIGQPPLLQIDAATFVEPWCYGGCDGSITIADQEAVEWSFNGGATYGASPTQNSLCAGTYALAIRNAAGCIGTMEIAVTEPPQVIAEWEYSPDPANVNAPTIAFHDLSQNAIAWQWDIAGLMETELHGPVYTFSNKYPGVYTVCLVASDAHACTDTICHDVIINDVLFDYVPNAFTPDGDGTNDKWGMSINIDDIADLKLMVFDRWGEVVFETTDPYGRWDGTYRNGGGEILKEDVYAYRIVFSLKSTGGAREHLGHVSLLK